MSKEDPLDAMFSGVIGQDYEMLKLICPLAAEMSRLVGLEVGNYQPATDNDKLQIVELGGGTGISTLNILSARDNCHIVSIDNEPTMQTQARENLLQWVELGKITFLENDALSALQNTLSESVDIVASAYTMHNFQDNYREQVIKEIFRILKPGGLFVNGDRYALDDITDHTRLIQRQVGEWFKVFTEINRPDLLEQWIIHLLSDESENHVMREGRALQSMQQAGFVEIKQTHRQEGNALVTAIKL